MATLQNITFDCADPAAQAAFWAAVLGREVAPDAGEFFAKEGDFQLAFLAGATAAADRVLFINAGRVLRLKRVVP